jgi:hypothetical protein
LHGVREVAGAGYSRLTSSAAATVIGVAYIDEDRCIAWADQRDCIVCEEMPAARESVA